MCETISGGKTAGHRVIYDGGPQAEAEEARRAPDANSGPPVTIP